MFLPFHWFKRTGWSQIYLNICFWGVQNQKGVSLKISIKIFRRSYVFICMYIYFKYQLTLKIEEKLHFPTLNACTNMLYIGVFSWFAKDYPEWDAILSSLTKPFSAFFRFIFTFLHLAGKIVPLVVSPCIFYIPISLCSFFIIIQIIAKGTFYKHYDSKTLFIMIILSYLIE